MAGAITISQPMTRRPEVSVDDGGRRKNVLRLSGGPEPLRLSFRLADVSHRPAAQIAAGPVFDMRQ